jgi:cell division ATPase FtsA
MLRHDHHNDTPPGMIIVIDLGSYKFRAGAFCDKHLIATAELVSDNWHPYTSKDILQARDIIDDLVKGLENTTMKIAKEIVIVLSDAQITTTTMAVSIQISEKTVSHDEKNSIVRMISGALNSKELSPLSIIPLSYQIDDGSYVENPLGISTSSVHAKCAVSAHNTTMHNEWLKALNEYYKDKQISLLSPDRFMGYYADVVCSCTCIVDIGHTTKMYLIENDKCTRIVDAPVSCDDLAQGITEHLLPLHVHKRVKSLYCAGDHRNDIHIHIGNKQLVFARKEISSIIHANASDVIQRLITALHGVGMRDRVQRFIFIGGGAVLLNEQLAAGILRDQLSANSSLRVMVPTHTIGRKNYGPEWNMLLAVGLSCAQSTRKMHKQSWWRRLKDFLGI